MIVAIKAMFDLMPKGGPLPLNGYPSPVDDSDFGIGCPYVANTLNHHGAANRISGGVFPDLNAIGGSIERAVPNDGDLPLSGANVEERGYQYIAHTQSLKYQRGLYKCL